MRLKENRCTTTHLEVFYAGTLGGDLSHRKLEYVACSERTGGAKRPRRQGVEPWKESLSNFLELFDKEKKEQQKKPIQSQRGSKHEDLGGTGHGHWRPAGFESSTPSHTAPPLL